MAWYTFCRLRTAQLVLDHNLGLQNFDFTKNSINNSDANSAKKRGEEPVQRGQRAYELTCFTETTQANVPLPKRLACSTASKYHTSSDTRWSGGGHFGLSGTMRTCSSSGAMESNKIEKRRRKRPRSCCEELNEAENRYAV